MWHHAVSQCRGIEDIETGKKHCVDPTARYPSKFHFDHLTKLNGDGLSCDGTKLVKEEENGGGGGGGGGIMKCLLKKKAC